MLVKIPAGKRIDRFNFYPLRLAAMMCRLSVWRVACVSRNCWRMASAVSLSYRGRRRPAVSGAIENMEERKYNNWMKLTAFKAAALRGECCAAAVYPRRYVSQ